MWLFLNTFLEKKSRRYQHKYQQNFSVNLTVPKSKPGGEMHETLRNSTTAIPNIARAT